MAPMTKTKKARSRYFKQRRGRSAHLGMRRLRLRMRRPSFHRNSENVPTGQSHEQKAFLKSRLMSTNARKRYMAAGWMEGTCPVSSRYLEFINPAMGSQPSTPAGRG